MNTQCENSFTSYSGFPQNLKNNLVFKRFQARYLNELPFEVSLWKFGTIFCYLNYYFFVSIAVLKDYIFLGTCVGPISTSWLMKC